MPITVSNIAERDIPGAITCIQQAFKDDPYNHWVFDKSDFSFERNAVSLGIRCRWGMQHALFHVAKDPSSSQPDQVLGVACWLPPRDPQAPETWHDWAGNWWLWLEQVRMNLWYGRGGLNVRRYWLWKQRQAEAQAGLQPQTPNGYYFCNIVTVLPEAQGRGIGKLLFKHVTDRADVEGRQCYLESSRATPNMEIYQKLGFGLAKEMVCDDEGTAITLFCMIREPSTAGGND
ncbi:hypothetical protein LTR53_011271 [Teratosphaeriaceae sp. CCFEE 6253]|nr:hypothetical protein LTR53_011271 [Teratosphaeriaceae sp. CCFEE 6253]